MNDHRDQIVIYQTRSTVIAEGLELEQILVLILNHIRSTVD